MRKSRKFRKSNLVKIADSSDFQDDREPEFSLGDIVMLNSGGPSSLVVDIDGSDVTVAWRSDEDSQIEEWTFNRACLHRVRRLW